MPSVGLIYFERENLPGRRRLDPLDPTTIDFDRPVYGFHARHALSEMFEIRVEFEYEDPDLELRDLLRRPTLVDLTAEGDEEPLVYRGVVERARYLRTRDHRSFYEVTLRPAVHRLRYRHDTRIFQHQAIPDIVRSVIAETGQELELRLSESYPELEYVVQYQETDLDFIHRLLEDEGLFYWFEHGPSYHLMCLGDASGVYRPLGDTGTLHFSNDRVAEANQVADLRFTTRVVHDVHTTRDWDWTRPNAPLEGEHAEGPKRRFERYEYPGGLLDEADAARRARARQEASAVRKYELTGVAGSARLRPALTFTLLDARPAEVNLDYVLTSVDHRLTTEETTEAAEHHIAFAAMPADQTFRPARRTPRPTVPGRDSAVVTGPADEEIHVDEFGRIKAQFYWDRHGQHDERSSKWIRVTQPNTVGSMYLPRIGWEMAVGYVNGDPDRPLVTHKQFNERHPPPYPLPDHLEHTTWQSLSSPGGRGYNEIRYDDTNAAMELYIRAERDWHARVGHDRFEAVGVNSTEEVLRELNTSVGAMESINVGIDQIKHIDDHMVAATGGTKTVTVAQLDSWNVRDNHTVTNDGNRRETIVGPRVVVARNITETVQGERRRVVGGALATQVGQSMVEAVGSHKKEVVDGTRVTLVGGSFIENISRTKSLQAGKGTFHSRGSWSTTGGSLDTSVQGNLTQEVTGSFGATGSTVTLEGSDELKARAGGAELVLGGDVLDVDASSFTSSGVLVRLRGQIEVIGAGSADSAEPEEPGPEDDWIEIALVDSNGDAVPNEDYVIQLPDGTERQGTLDSSGRAREDGLPPGTVVVSFPNFQPSETEDAS